MNVKLDRREVKDTFVIIGILSVVCIFSISLLGNNLQDSITKSTCQIAGKVYVDGMTAGEGSCMEKW